MKHTLKTVIYETDNHIATVLLNAFGGGLEMALACDIRIFNERAKVSLPESSLSMQPGYGGTQRLTHLVGPSCAKKLMFTGQTVTAAEALRIGLADEVAAEGETLHMAQKMAETIAEKAPIAITTIKESVDFALSHSLEEGFAFETAGIGKLCGTMDKQEGAAAFIEKRKPVFRNH